MYQHLKIIHLKTYLLTHTKPFNHNRGHMLVQWSYHLMKWQYTLSPLYGERVARKKDNEQRPRVSGFPHCWAWKTEDGDRARTAFTVLFYVIHFDALISNSESTGITRQTENKLFIRVYVFWDTLSHWHRPYSFVLALQFIFGQN